MKSLYWVHPMKSSTTCRSSAGSGREIPVEWNWEPGSQHKVAGAANSSPQNDGKNHVFLMFFASQFRFRIRNMGTGQKLSKRLMISLHLWEVSKICRYVLVLQNRPHPRSEWPKVIFMADPGWSRCRSSWGLPGLLHSEDERRSDRRRISGATILVPFSWIGASFIWNHARIWMDVYVEMEWGVQPEMSSPQAPQGDKLFDHQLQTSDIRRPPSLMSRKVLRMRRGKCSGKPFSGTQGRKVLEKAASFGWKTATSTPDV